MGSTMKADHDQRLRNLTTVAVCGSGKRGVTVYARQDGQHLDVPAAAGATLESADPEHETHLTTNHGVRSLQPSRRDFVCALFVTPIAIRAYCDTRGPDAFEQEFRKLVAAINRLCLALERCGWTEDKATLAMRDYALIAGAGIDPERIKTSVDGDR